MSRVSDGLFYKFYVTKANRGVMIRNLIIAWLCIGTGLVTSEAPSALEVERAKVAIMKMLGNSQYLPTAVRLGR